MAKRRVNCSVDGVLLDLARIEGINISQTLEDGLRDALDINGHPLDKLFIEKKEAFLKSQLLALEDRKKIKKTQNKRYDNQQKTDKNTIDNYLKGLLDNKKKSQKTGPGKFILNKRVHLKLLNERLNKKIKLPEFEEILVKWGVLDG